MGSLQEKSSLLGNNRDTVSEECEKEGDEDYEKGFGSDGWGYFRFLPLRWKRCDRGERVSLLQVQGEKRERLWMRRLKEEAKGMKELLCVHKKWKKLIRKLRAYAINNINNRKRRKLQFHYDPQSYALNFDQGEGEDRARFDFCSRFGGFAAPSIR